MIGNGYNHYRPGFNGGALETGKLAAGSAFNSRAIAALKEKRNAKTNLQSARREVICPSQRLSMI